MTTAPAGTRDQILDEALRLFGERGFRDTTVSDIQAAVGLSSGSGALYRHFTSKEEVVEAGIERWLVHLEALHRSAELLGRAVDLRAELEVFGRFLLLEIEAEKDVVRVLLRDGHRFPGLVARVRDRLLSPLLSLVAGWLAGHVRAGHLAPETDVEAVAVLVVGAIGQHAVTRALLGDTPGGVDDERLLAAWAGLIASQAAAT